MSANSFGLKLPIIGILLVVSIVCITNSDENGAFRVPRVEMALPVPLVSVVSLVSLVTLVILVSKDTGWVFFHFFVVGTFCTKCLPNMFAQWSVHACACRFGNQIQIRALCSDMNITSHQWSELYLPMVESSGRARRRERIWPTSLIFFGRWNKV